MIVYACVRGFGDPRTGESPYFDWPSLDAAAQSFGGLVHANDGLVTPAIADIFPGTLMALGVVSAIHHAQKSGVGQFLDVAMYDAMMAFQKSAVAQFGFTGKPNPAGLQRAMTLYPFDLFPTKDGRIALAVAQPRHWDLLCAAMERADLMIDERSESNAARLKNVDWVEEQIVRLDQPADPGGNHGQAGWQHSGGPGPGHVGYLRGRARAGPADARDLPARRRQSGNQTGRQSHQVHRHTPTGLYQAPPNLGEHNAEVLAEFGIEMPGESNDG